MRFLHFLTIATAIGASITACRKDDRKDLPYQYQSAALDLPDQPYNYSKADLPDHFFDTEDLISQKVTDDGATLGRVLFYDPKLSLTNQTACASCHLQEKAFADPVALSKGFDGGLTKRNASAIINPVNTRSFFWDARESNLKDMVLRPIENHVEMGMDNFDALVKKLNSVDYYPPLFKKAFGDESITKERIAESLSQFLNSMVTSDSKFDQSRPNGWGSDDPSVFNDQEQRGMGLFFGQARCAMCHNLTSVPNGFFGQEEFANIGLDMNPVDKGMGEKVPGQEGVFKIPSLRNVALTAPYMHDGRFTTLEEVVNHYNENIQPVPNLSWALQDGQGGGIKLQLTATQQQDLIAFLHTLTDDQFVHDEKFSNPFVK